MSGSLRRFLDRLSDRDVPAGFTGELAPGERVLGVAELPAGGHLVATSRGLWLPEADRARLVGWHVISKATWAQGALTVVEAEETGSVGGAVLLADRPAWRVPLRRAGRVPEVVHARVTGSIKSSHHRDLPGGGAWVVQRSVSGQDGMVLQVRADPGTDPDAVRSFAANLAEQVGRLKRPD